MINDKISILNQIQRNAVALISLVIAVSSLSYTTWRNEETEYNRNQRYAAFEILVKLNELQLVVFHQQYDKDITNKSNFRIGWAYVLTIKDLSEVLRSPLPDKANELLTVWNQNWGDLGETQSSVESILSGIDETRIETLKLLKSLE